jgi:hypothetical protein
MPSPEPRDEDLLSLAACRACAHAESGHDHLGCFLDREGRTREEYTCVPETRQLLKEIGAECWCRNYETDVARGIDSLLKYGNAAALVVATNAAVERGDTFSAERLLDEYVRTVHGHRDSEWVRATERTIARLQSHATPASQCQPLEDADSPRVDEGATEGAKRKDSRPIRPFSQAPRPIVPVRGSVKRLAAKPTSVPLNLPPDYPNQLEPRTILIVGEAVRKFSVQPQILELCRYVISQLTEHLYAEAESKRLRADLVLSHATALLRSLLAANCDDSSQVFDLERKIKISDEWLTLARKLADTNLVNCVGSVNQGSKRQSDVAKAGVRAAVDAFLGQCNREANSSVKVIRKHIWRAVGHKNARQFEYWQAGSAEATGADKQNFGRVLDMNPVNFVELLKKNGLL